MPLTSVSLVCTLKPSPEPSSALKIAQDIEKELAKHDVENTIIRLRDFVIIPGVKEDMGTGDEWPGIREQILAADILVIATPTWMGHASSLAYSALERLDADLGKVFGKVAIVGIVGNEDGAHKISADLFQALNDVGFSIPAQGATYWNDEAMGSRNYKDLESIPENTAATNAMVAKNAAHLAGLLKTTNYPE